MRTIDILLETNGATQHVIIFGIEDLIRRNNASMYVRKCIARLVKRKKIKSYTLRIL